MRECRDHGYFRAEYCSVCGEEGRFLMNDEELDRLHAVGALYEDVTVKHLLEQ